MDRTREAEPLRALVLGREEFIARASQPEASPDEEARGRTRPARTEPPVAPPPVRPAPARAMRRLLGSRRSLRQAMLAQAVLGPPRSLQIEDRPS